jgi:hypothetical protein
VDVEECSAAAVGKGGGGKNERPVEEVPCLVHWLCLCWSLNFSSLLEMRASTSTQATLRSRPARCFLQRHGLGERISQSIQILTQNTNHVVHSKASPSLAHHKTCSHLCQLSGICQKAIGFPSDLTSLFFSSLDYLDDRSGHRRRSGEVPLDNARCPIEPFDRPG